MHNQQKYVLLGTRIPSRLKEKLQEIAEDNQDISIAGERLKDAGFTSQKEFNKYLLKRKKG